MSEPTTSCETGALTADRLPHADEPWRRDSWMVSTWRYEFLRLAMKDNGFDPEQALEDDGYGIGIGYPEGVDGPSAEEARSLIDQAKAATHRALVARSDSTDRGHTDA